MARTSIFANTSTPPMASSSVFFFFLLLLLLYLLPFATPDEAAEKAALLQLKQAVGSNRVTWNQSAPLCSWYGVKCTTGGSISELRLPGDSLRGAIPTGIFGNLTSLNVLSLRSNALSGPLPSDLASCTQLQQLHLQQNRLSGDFPAVILSLNSLTHLVLAENNLSGPIPPDLTNLKNLEVLGLELNRFSGELPDLDLPQLNEFNVSYNLLNGSIPPGLRRMPANAFLGMSLCDGPFPSCTSEDKKKLSTGAIVGIAVGSAIALLVVVAMVLLVCCRRKGSRAVVADTENGEINPAVTVEAKRWLPPPSPSPRGPPAGGEKKALVFLGNRESDSYELEELLRASAEVLGKGTFGTTYKATMENGKVVAAKRLKVVEVGEEEFRTRVEAIGDVEHPNVVGVDSYHYSRDEKLLVYKYMPMGSLSALLHGSKGAGRVPLIWPTRLNIALTAARGIEYIHSRDPESCHGNIKSSNILLTQSYDAVISDQALFQLAKPIPSTRASGYLAPEVNDLQKVTQKADVYSFGVLLLETLTGKEPGHSPHDDGTDLLKWVLTFPRDEWSDEVFDMELLRFQSAQDEMEGLLEIAINCCRQSPDNRPTMSEIVSQIMEIQAESAEPIDGEDSNNISPLP